MPDVPTAPPSRARRPAYFGLPSAMRLILIRVRRADPRGRVEPLRGRPALQGMTIPENRKQRSPTLVGIMTAGVNPSPAARTAASVRPRPRRCRERFPLQVPRGRRWPRQRGSTLSLPGQAGRFVWRRAGGLADDGGRAAIAAQFPSHERVNQTDDAQELEALRRSVQRGRPFGQPEWQKEIAKRLGLESAYRPTGRSRKVGRNQNTSPG